MQENLASAPTWLQTSIQWLASFLAGASLVKLIDIWLNRKKPAAEIHVTQATAEEIKVRSYTSAAQGVMSMMTRLDEAQDTIDRLREERDDWRSQALESKERELKADDDAKAAQLFVDQLNAAAKLTVCEHYPNGVRLADYTPKQLNSK